MNKINITIELCAEDRARLDAILAALTHTHDTATEAAERPQETAEETTQPLTPPQEKKPEKTAPAPSDSEPEQTVSRADVQRLVVDLSAAGKKAEVKEIVMAYADRVSAITEDKLAEVYAKLSELGG